MTRSDNTLNKVRKLLTLAEDPAATPAEAAAFTAKAAQLMTDYGIDQALLMGQDRTAHSMGDRKIGFEAPYARDKCSLVCRVAQVMRCKAVILGGDAKLTVHLFGLKSDLDCIEMLGTSLLLQGTRDLAAAAIPPHEHVPAYRRSWWAGFSAAIQKRLLQAESASISQVEQRQPDSGPSVALVLADHTHQAEVAMYAAYPRLRMANPRRLSGGGAAHGYASGQCADLGTASRIDSPGRQQLSF